MTQFKQVKQVSNASPLEGVTKESIMPSIVVEISWDQPKERFWLNAGNVSLALHAYCKNTRFEVKEIQDTEQGETEVK